MRTIGNLDRVEIDPEATSAATPHGHLATVPDRLRPTDRSAWAIEIVRGFLRALDHKVQLTGTRRDLHQLQRMIEEGFARHSREQALQALEIAFGEIMARELGLEWAAVDPAHREHALVLGPGLLFPLSFTRAGAGRTRHIDLRWLFEILERVVQFNREWKTCDAGGGQLICVRR
jgi:hypothetical protein